MKKIHKLAYRSSLQLRVRTPDESADKQTTYLKHSHRLTNYFQKMKVEHKILKSNTSLSKVYRKVNSLTKNKIHRQLFCTYI